MRILVVNAGSATVKLRVIDDHDQVVSTADLGPPDSRLAGELGEFLARSGPIDVVGHRVVHGGSLFCQATLITEQVIASLDTLTELAPLHNPPALTEIEATRRLLPHVPSVACFDTAFHATMPPAATAYAVPADWVARWGIRRYGFHGLSCAWSTRRACTLLAPQQPGAPTRPLRLVICHLGGGASVTAVSDGRSLDTTMGFTPLEGLVMATRSGDIDPGALLWVLTHGLSTDEARDDLEQRSGLLGLSGALSSDMRQVLAARDGGTAQAALAVAVYVHRLRAKIAAMAAALGGIDALIFTAGVGEHSAPIRTETCAGLNWMGVDLDQQANDAVDQADCDISAVGATVRTLVVHAREDLQIAAECRQLLQVRADDSAH